MKVRVGFTVKMSFVKDVTMSRAEFDKINQQLDDEEIDAEDLFDNFRIDMNDPTAWDTPELDDFHELEKEKAA